MRRHPATTALLVVVVPLFGLLLLGPGCAGAKETAPPPAGGGSTTGPAEPMPQMPPLELSRELAGRTVVHAEQGVWHLRTTNGGGSGGPGAVSEGVAESRALGIGIGGGGDVPASGAPPAASAAAPSPVAGGSVTGGKSAPSRESEPADRAEDDAHDARSDSGGGEMESDELEDAKRSRSDFDAPAKKPADAKYLRDDASSGVRNLRAGATDDNADFDAFLSFLAEWPQQDVMKAGYQPLDVRDRRFIRVVDSLGRPVPGAEIGITDVSADRLIATATTYGDGRAPFYPHLDEPAAASGAESVGVPVGGYVIEARHGDERVRATWTANEDELTLTLGSSVALADPFELDVLFLIDTTGSMGDEIASIKASLLKVTEQIRSIEREFQLRYGAVLYRDIGDDYVTATHEFTSDIESFDKALSSVRAQGGGDGPESVNQGLAQAIGGVDWRPGAAKVVFLIGDAPPHMDYAGDTWYGQSVRAAVGKGIRIHSVAASGLDARGTLVWRQIAQFTRGKFIFIEYGTPAASAESHGVKGAVKSNNLEDILFEQIRDELAQFGR